MDQQEKQEMREIVENCSLTMMTKVGAQHEIINAKLDGINAHLKGINGKVQRHEEQIFEALSERGRNRQLQSDNFKDLEDLIPKVRQLEDSQLTSMTIKKWIIGSVAVTGTLIAIVTTIIKFITESGA